MRGLSFFCYRHQGNNNIFMEITFIIYFLPPLFCFIPFIFLPLFFGSLLKRIAFETARFSSVFIPEDKGLEDTERIIVNNNCIEIIFIFK